MVKSNEQILEELEEKWNEDSEQFDDELFKQFYKEETKTLYRFTKTVRVSFEVEVNIISVDRFDADNLCDENITIQDYANGSCGVETDYVSFKNDDTENAIEVDNYSVSGWKDDQNYSSSMSDGEDIELYKCSEDDYDDSDSWFDSQEDCKENWLYAHKDDYKDEFFDTFLN